MIISRDSSFHFLFYVYQEDTFFLKKSLLWQTAFVNFRFVYSFVASTKKGMKEKEIKVFEKSIAVFISKHSLKNKNKIIDPILDHNNHH